ncbi:MAG: ATP-dependent endonuclease, partial [candidate division Zixibacteria bacterium]|nr:ATP-dependent endonuclease [candidate division Zixibacteria bacterium]
LMDAYSKSDFEQLGKVENIDGCIFKTISESEWSDEIDKKKALIAAHYWKFVDALKGERALQLDYNLRTNLHSAERVRFEVPRVIKGAINWMCG